MKIARLVVLFGVLYVGNTSADEHADDNCNFTLSNNSIVYFESRLKAANPKFIRFTLRFINGTNLAHTTSTSTAVLPYIWVWTYTSPTSNYPFLSWNIDHGLLSFGLLDSQTYEVNFVAINVSEDCTIELGSANITHKIAQALIGLTSNIKENGFYTYDDSSLCYLEEQSGIRNTFQYTAGLYLNYPNSFINYKCCYVTYNYTNNQFETDCLSTQHEKWTQCTQGPYYLGLAIFLYFPILFFEICAWLARSEQIVEENEEYEEIKGNDTKPQKQNILEADDWIILGENPPLSLADVLNLGFCGIDRKYPVFVSRLRRLIALILAPSIIYIQLWMYRGGIGDRIKIHVSDLVQHGTPVGFLSLLSNSTSDKIKVFAPAFGGPVCLLIVYHALGIVFIVFPKSLKQIVERGIPRGRWSSPLFLCANEIIHYSMLRVSPKAGYEKASVVCKCSVYMLFGKRFWTSAYDIQRQRWLSLMSRKNLALVLKIFICPLYIVFCAVELLLCVIRYGFPAFGMIQIIVKGALKSILMFRLQDTVVSIIFRSPLVIFVGSIVVFTMFIFDCYVVCMIFIQSFQFISQIVIYCLIAVIVYPSVSFGYLFFFVVLLYYIVRLIKDFGEGYQELLQVAVEQTCEIYGHISHVTQGENGLFLPGFSRSNSLLDDSHSVQRKEEKQCSMKKCIEVDSMFGIPKELFECLVRMHRPVHIQCLNLFCHLFSIIFLVSITLSITSKFDTGASSEISDVMHVIFLVTVGALPRVLEVAMSNSSEVVRREIESRRIGESIREFWSLKAGGSSVSIECA